jgi:hypothetical protein
MPQNDPENEQNSVPGLILAANRRSDAAGQVAVDADSGVLYEEHREHTNRIKSGCRSVPLVDCFSRKKKVLDSD